MFQVLRGDVPLELFLIQVVVLILALSVHEYAHARSAYRFGDTTAAEAGRLTLNPLAHLEPIGTLMILAGAPIAWAKPVPVNPSRFRNGVSMRKGMALTSLAGPLSNLICSAIAYLLLSIYGHFIAGYMSTDFWNSFGNFLSLTLMIAYRLNIFLAIFNLLPLPPLDGSKIWAPLLPNKAYYWLMRNERYIGLGLLALVLFFAPELGRVLDVLAWPFEMLCKYLIGVPISWLAGLF